MNKDNPVMFLLKPPLLDDFFLPWDFGSSSPQNVNGPCVCHCMSTIWGSWLFQEPRFNSWGPRYHPFSHFIPWSQWGLRVGLKVSLLARLRHSNGFRLCVPKWTWKKQCVQMTGDRIGNMWVIGTQSNACVCMCVSTKPQGPCQTIGFLYRNQESMEQDPHM